MQLLPSLPFASKKEIQILEQRLSEMEAQDLEPRLRAIEEQGLDERLRKIETWIDGQVEANPQQSRVPQTLEQRVLAIENRLGALSEQIFVLEKLIEKMDKINGRVDKVELWITKVNDSMNAEHINGTGGADPAQTSSALPAEPVKGSLSPVSAAHVPSAANGEPPSVPQPQGQPPDFEAKLQEAEQRERERYKADMDLITEHEKEANYWLERAMTLRDGIEKAEQACVQEAQRAVEILQTLPPDIQEALKGRQEGIALVGTKMLAQAKQIKLELSDKPGKLPEPCTPGALRTLVANETDLTTGNEKIEARLDEISAANYGVVSAWRVFARETQRAFVSHVSRTVVPAIEGLDTGEKNAKELVVTLQSKYPANADVLQNWFGAYARCRTPILEALSAVDIHPMEVTLKSQPDYTRHRASAVEPTSTDEDETILSVQRNGYEMKSEKDERALVIREAWVVVAKKVEA